MIRAGLAWHFKKYSDSEILNNLEIEARNKKVGLWRDRTPKKPGKYENFIKTEFQKKENF